MYVRGLCSANRPDCLLRCGWQRLPLREKSQRRGVLVEVEEGRCQAVTAHEIIICEDEDDLF